MPGKTKERVREGGEKRKLGSCYRLEKCRWHARGKRNADETRLLFLPREENCVTTKWYIIIPSDVHFSSLAICVLLFSYITQNILSEEHPFFCVAASKQYSIASIERPTT